MIILGYARVSTDKQKIERQLKNLTKYDPSIFIFQETYSSRTLERPQLQKMLNYVDLELSKNKEITIVFDSVSRMSRDAEEGAKLYFELEKKSVNLVFLNEPHINTETYKKVLNLAIPDTNSEMVNAILEGIRKGLKIKAKEDIRLAFEQAEKELLDIRKRTSQGIAVAKINGKQIGRIKGKTYKTKRGDKLKANLQKHHRAFEGTMTDEEFISTFKCGKSTFYKYKGDLREELKHE